MSVSRSKNTAELERVFPGDSEMADRMRAFDWSQRELGPPETWSQNLCLGLGLCLASRVPMQVWWGSALTLFYNDACIPLLGREKHPAIFGRSGREAWVEIWDAMGPRIEQVFRDGTASWLDDLLVFCRRELPQEEVYLSFSFSPVFGEDRRVEGLYCICTETTEKIVGNRRLETLRRLGVDTNPMRDVAEACRVVGEALSQNPHDIPFAAVYILDESQQTANLTATAGISESRWLLPRSVSITDEDDDSTWPLAAVLRTKRAAEVADLGARGIQLQAGPWSDSVKTMVIVPVRAAADRLAGLLVAGVSARGPWNAAYRNFFELVASQIAMAIAGARPAERRVEAAPRRSHEELERRVRERTSELEETNQALRREAFERDHVETRLNADLAALTKMHDLSGRLLKVGGFQPLLHEIMDAAVAIMGAERGTLHLLDGNQLRIVAHHGHRQPYLDFFASLENLASVCGEAILSGERKVDRDIEKSRLLVDTPSLAALREAGVRAMQSTPMISRTGALLGVLTTQWGVPHFSNEHDLWRIDLLLRQAADLIELKQAEEALRRSEEQYRTLFRSIDEGFTILDVIFDEDDRPFDIYHVELNPSAIRMIGHDFTGRLLSEIHPDFEAYWFEIFGHVARTGESRRLERYAEPLKTWFDFYVFKIGPPGSRRIATLFQNITERKRAEEAVAADLRDTQMLRELSARLVSEGDLQVLYQEIMTVAIALMRADAGSVQILDRQTCELVLLATQGFPRAMTDHFHRLDASSNTSCGVALATGARTFVDFDIPEQDDPSGSLRMHVEAGYLSAQSTPLITRSGKPIGMLSTHWREHRRPTERELRFLDLLARQAADLIERREAEEALRQAHDVLEQKVAERTRELRELAASLQDEIKERAAAESQVRELLRRLINIQEEERRRIAREIHDQVGQQMTALRLYFESLLARCDEFPDVAKQARQMQELAQELDQSIDFLTWELRPVSLEHLGLSVALDNLVRGWSDRFQIAAEYHASGVGGLRLAPDVEANLYRLTQEALHNVYKHARANHVGVLLERSGDRVALIIEDDGQGFDPDRMGASGAEGLGFISMRERAALVGGELEVESSLGGGTTIFVRAPLTPEKGG